MRAARSNALIVNLSKCRSHTCVCGMGASAKVSVVAERRESVRETRLESEIRRQKSEEQSEH